jgi:hypothetical protein
VVYGVPVAMDNRAANRASHWTAHPAGLMP